MGSLPLVDTFPAFQEFWTGARDLPVERQIALWEREYMAPWPELLAKQKENYRSLGVEWKKVARARIFPQLPDRLERMRRLHAGLLRALPHAWAGARKRLGIRFPVRFVIYVGIGCGMGWATRLKGQPAVLFGLENAAEQHDGSRNIWPGLVAHEVAHLAHYEWRRQHHRATPDPDRSTPPFWQLYEEGFATQAEREVSDPEAFALRTGDPRWLPWCERHRRWLATKFLEDVRARRSVRPFFGSWYNVRGHIETGYYLGAEVVREWRRAWSFETCAVLSEDAAKELARKTLRGIASGEIPAQRTGHGRPVPTVQRHGSHRPGKLR